jgi:drug/metabolite transporter (DMT)-like permease
MNSGTARRGDRQSFGRGIALATLSVAFYACMIASIKHVITDYSIFQILFFRNLLSLPIIIPIALAVGGPRNLRTDRFPLHLLRITVTMTSHLCLFIGLGSLALVDVSGIQFTAPLIVTALAALVLREHVGVWRWFAVFVGFTGVMVMSPPTGELNPAVLIVLFGTFCYAVMVIMTRVLVRTDPVGAIAFYQALVGTAVGLVALPWVWSAPSVPDLLVLMLVGVLAGFAQLCLIGALKAAPPTVLAPLDYTVMLWAVGFDVILWHTAPSSQVLLGAAIIAAAGLFIAHRETAFFHSLWRALSEQISLRR